MAEGNLDLDRFRNTPAQRVVQQGGRRPAITVRNGPKDGWRDVYHYLLIWSWPAFVAAMAFIYLAVNIGFALLFWIDVDAVSDHHPGRFMDAFNFSVETLGTIGYGAMSPHDAYTNFLVLVEAFTSIFLTAVLTGLIFARVSRPTARVLFSDKAILTTFDGKRTLMFRAANQRANQMLEAEVTLTLVKRAVTIEGVPIRRFEVLKPIRGRSPLFAISWTVMHVVDENSPLHGMSDEELRETSSEIVVTIAGIDEVTTQRVHSRHSYVADEIVWDHQFVDVVIPLEDGSGKWVIDYARFHDVRPA